MKTYPSISRREIPYAIMLLLFVLPLHNTAQGLNRASTFEKFLQQAQEDSFSLAARKRFLWIAYNSITPTATDSIRYSRMSEIVEVASHLEDSLLFHHLAQKGYKLALGLDNPNHLGDSHWNYGSYYLRKQQYDSSYYHYNQAYLKFMEGNKEYYAGKMLYNMAYIATETRDLTGAEILLFRSIQIFEHMQKPRQLYRSYNILGNNADDLEEFDKSLIYYQKAARLISSFENATYYQLENWNNLGVRLYKMRLYDRAIPFFDRALQQKKTLAIYPSLHALLLDNRAYCLVSLGIYNDVSIGMQYAQRLRDSLGDISGSVTSRLRFAGYYGKTGDTLRGIAAAAEALDMAQSNYLTPHVLQALEILSRLDKPKSIHYLQQHIALDKQLNARDRKLRNKFTAIQYETDKYIAENERLFQQRLWLSLASISSALLFVLIYLNARQRAKNKELVFEREQQQYNEDMFLMALKQKSNLERGRTEERQRISQELHDGIVSRLFTLRFRWYSVRLGGETGMLALHKQFLEMLALLERDIRNLSHELRNVVFYEAGTFLDLLENLIKEKSGIGNFSYRLECKNPTDWESLPYIAKINLQRLFEEVLQNVVKHAQAKKVTVHMDKERDILKFKIKDDGNGFDPSRIKKGMGIKNIGDRSLKLMGKFEMYSSPGVGTQIYIQIPIKKNLE